MKPVDKHTEMALFGQDAETRKDAIQLAFWIAEKMGLDATAGHLKIAEVKRTMDGQKQTLYRVLITAQGLFHLAAQKGISLEVLSCELKEGMAIVTAKATAPYGYSVTALGVSDFDRFRRYRDKEDSAAVANAIMAADTKAKARAIRAMLSAPLSDAEAEGVGMSVTHVVPAEVIDAFGRVSDYESLMAYAKEVYALYKDAIKPLARSAALRIQEQTGEVMPENFAKWLGL